MLSLARKASGKHGGSLILTLFGAIFIIAGLIPGGIALHSLYQVMDAGDWVSVPATVLDARLVRGEDTARVEARYRYRYAGRDYEGERVSFHGGSDNIGDFHQATHSRLQRHRDDGEPVTVYVNPDAPAQAVIVRDMRWGLFGFMMLFPLLFSGAGAGVLVAARYGEKKAAEQDEIRSRYPDEPWRWRPEWANGVVQADTRNTLWVAVLFAGIWNLISLPLPFLLWDEVLEKGNYAALLGLLFPVVGVFLAVWAVKSYLRLRRYGKMTFTLDNFPAPLGGRLAGKFHSPTRLPAGSVIDARLTCVRKRTSGSGKNRSTRESFLWQDEQRLRLQAHHVLQGTRVHIAFALPADRPSSDDSDPGNQILWRLELTADVPGVDLHSVFEVPVFDTGKQAPYPPAAREQISEAAEAADWQRTGVLAQRTAQGWELDFPPFRHKGMSLLITLFAAVFWAATLFLFHEEQTFMGSVFGLFAVLIAWGAAHVALHRSRVVAREGSLQLQRGYLVLGSPRTWTASEIAAIDIAAGTRAGNTQFYDLVMRDHNAHKTKLAHTLPGRRDAQALADLVAQTVVL